MRWFIILYILCLISKPLSAQNMASIEVPLGISFVYGLDYHPVFYTQIKPFIGFAFGDSYIAGKWSMLQYGVCVEKRYYYNMLKRQLKGKNTLHKSANFISIKPSFMYEYYLNKMLIHRNKSIYSCPFNWGLRRSISRRFYFDGSVGVGPAYNTDDKCFYFSGNLHVSIGLKIF